MEGRSGTAPTAVDTSASIPNRRNHETDIPPSVLAVKLLSASMGKTTEIPVVRTLAALFASIPSSPPTNRIAIGFTPRKKAASDNPPSTANPKSFTAAFPRRHIAIPITAITAALIPASTGTACSEFRTERRARRSPR